LGESGSGRAAAAADRKWLWCRQIGRAAELTGRVDELLRLLCHVLVLLPSLASTPHSVVGQLAPQNIYSPEVVVGLVGVLAPHQLSYQ